MQPADEICALRTRRHRREVSTLYSNFVTAINIELYFCLDCVVVGYSHYTNYLK